MRFDPVWSAWLCLFNDDAPTFGIVARWAASPWGPWSDGRVVFANVDGLRRFIHEPGRDHTQEGFGVDRTNVWGGVYGPYQISRYSQQTDIGTRLFFTLSVWNPYQTCPFTFTTNLCCRFTRRTFLKGSSDKTQPGKRWSLPLWPRRTRQRTSSV